jgi:hypothetical protein
MSVPAWPSSIPQNLLLSNYSETWPDIVVRTQMDAGPAKVRRRFTADVRPVKGKLTLSGIELNALRTFYLSDCAGGAIAFSWTDPIGPGGNFVGGGGGNSDNALPAQPVTMRFVKQPVVTQTALNTYDVTLDLEVLP